MRIIDGIAYAEDYQPLIRVKGVRPLDDYRLWLRFTTDEVRIFDFKPLLDLPCYEALKAVEAFNSVCIDYGHISWNDGETDISADQLYRDSAPVEAASTAT